VETVGINELAAAFGDLPGALVGRGPGHPSRPEPSVAADLLWFFNEQYPNLKADPGYVEFMWKYGGLSRLDENENHLFYLYGFGPATADILHDLDENLADEEGMFTFAECTVDGDIPERPLDSYSVNFGFDLTLSRSPGVYRYESATHTTHALRTPWVWHTMDFARFLAEAVDRGGVWPRPQLGPSAAPEGDPMTTPKSCRFWQHNRDLQQVFAIVTQDGLPPVAYGPLALQQIVVRSYLEPMAGVPPADAALAAELASWGAEFHDLEEYYRYAGYAEEVIEWVEATQINRLDLFGDVRPEGRWPAEVAQRLGLDVRRVVEAASEASVAPHRVDPEGRNVYYEEFWDNWAVGDESGHLAMNPKSYRFKAWVAFNTDNTDNTARKTG
jgi:hypothetical protein